MLRKLATAAALTFGLATAANATVMIPDGPFQATTDTVYQSLNTATGAFTAWGLLSTNANGFNCTGCELTFVASGYNVSGAMAFGGTTIFNYTGGSIKVYLDNTPNFNGTIASAQEGSLWLDLAGALDNEVKTFQGVINSVVLSGAGSLDAVGGSAQEHFDTNSLDGGVDIKFSTTFTSNVTTGQTVKSFGAGTFTGKAIPEPASIALLGLGLLGFAGVARRRKA